MNRILILIGLMLSMIVAAPAFAQSECDNLRVTGLSDSQVIALKQECVKVAKQSVIASPAETAAQVSEYADIGMKYGVAISEVAKSIGTTVNELAFTPVGVFLLVVVAWKTIGGDLLGVVGGALWFVIMLPAWWIVFNRLVFKRLIDITETYGENGKLLRRTREPVRWTESTVTPSVLLFFVLVAICSAGFVMVF